MSDNVMGRFHKLFGKNKHEKTTGQLKNSSSETSEGESSHEAVDFREYSRQEIEHATNNFNESLKIEEGAYGHVYKGSFGNKNVAIKVLKHVEGSQGLDNEFNQELEVFSKIKHPNLVSLIGACPEAHATVYEYPLYGSLDNYLSNGQNSKKFPWQQRLRIASEICSALIFFHSQSIAHGNLEPKNVLFDSNLVSKLIYFCTYRKLEYSNETVNPLHETKRPMGSLAYIDPVYHAYGQLTPQSDIFAFGIILLQFVTGRDARGLRIDVEKAVYMKKLVVDSSAGEWPISEAMKLAELGLKCSDPSRNRRPNLEDEVRPALKSMLDASHSHSK
ncbi:hypothetical protein LUZ60_009745 [Juncus effusus]|nr:hypothetical protein LUZ60_009745 [Juncus effusus]